MAHTKTDESFLTEEKIESKTNQETENKDEETNQETENKDEEANHTSNAFKDATLTTIAMQIINLGLGSVVNYYNDKQPITQAALLHLSSRIFISKLMRDYIEYKYIKDICTDPNEFCFETDSMVTIMFRTTVGFIAGSTATIIAFTNPNQLTPHLSSSTVVFLNGLNSAYYDFIDAITKSKLLDDTIGIANQTKGLVAETFDSLIKADSYIGKVAGVLKGILYDNLAPYIKASLLEVANYFFAKEEDAPAQSSPTGEIDDNIATDEL